MGDPRLPGKPTTETPDSSCAAVSRRGSRSGSQRMWMQNLSCKIVIKDLAASLDISVRHFCRAFKCTFGMPARIWIRQRRIEFAQGLMLTTRASLSEIALCCGMSDQSHFTRSFRRIVREAPSSWRLTRHGAIEERVTSVAYLGKTKPIARSREGARLDR
jgi:AraC-like DNA-binding protein